MADHNALECSFRPRQLATDDRGVVTGSANFDFRPAAKAGLQAGGGRTKWFSDAEKSSAR